MKTLSLFGLGIQALAEGQKTGLLELKFSLAHLFLPFLRFHLR